MFSEQSRVEIQRLRRPHRVELVATLLSYVFKGCRQSDVRELVEERGLEFDFLHWRRHLHRNGDFLLYAKVYCYAYFCSKRFYDRDFLVPSSLSDEDKRLCRSAVLHPTLWSALEAHAQRKCCVWDEVAFQEFVQTILSDRDLVSFTRSFIFMKLNFLTTIFDDTREGLTSDLNTWALFSLLKAYPHIENVGHGLAIAKTTIHNRGINIIKERRASVRDRAQSWHVNLETCFNATAPDPASGSGFSFQSALTSDIDGNARSVLSTDMAASIDSLKSSPSLTPLERRAVRLLTGDHCEAFSEELGSPNECAVETLPYPKYWKAVMKHLGLDSDAESRLRLSIRSGIS